MKQSKWIQIPEMSTPRSLATGAVLAGTLFIIGGRDEIKGHNSVEYYMPSMKRWMPAAPMNEVRTAAQAGVVNGNLYVLGGTWTNVLGTIERYDPEADKWLTVSPIQPFVTSF